MVDLKTDLILAVEIRSAKHGDAQTLVDSVLSAQANLQAMESDAKIVEAMAENGNHRVETLTICTYITAPKRPDAHSWLDKPADQQRAVNANCRCMQRDKGKQLRQQRSERVERSFAPARHTGRGRRGWSWGETDVTNRYLVATDARILNRVLRKL